MREGENLDAICNSAEVFVYSAVITEFKMIETVAEISGVHV